MRRAVEGIGRTMQSFHFACCDDDAFVFVDAAHNVAAVALGLAVSSAGLAGVKTVVLLSLAEIDEAAKRQVGYKAPGQWTPAGAVRFSAALRQHANSRFRDRVICNDRAEKPDEPAAIVSIATGAHRELEKPARSFHLQ